MEDGSGTAYTDNASLTLTEDTTLCAQWILITDYTVLLPDGDNITVDPATKIGSAQIGIQSGSTIPEEKQLQMSVNAGTENVLCINRKENAVVEKPKSAEEYVYQVDKIRFIVTPIYKETGESMRDILLKLMLADLEPV